MKQLKCADLRGGDLMLKAADGSLIARAISMAEKLRGQANPAIVHAGLMFDGTYIIEALENGIAASDLRIQNRTFGYLVHRPKSGWLSRGAAACAKMMFDVHQRNGSMKYNFPLTAIAPGSMGKPASRTAMDRLLDDLLRGRGHPFYCSQFAVYVYQFVAEQNGISAATLFHGNDARISPSTLASLLQGNPWFEEAGYVMPNER